jgi:hypothetical protein
MITIATYRNLMSAELAQTHLESYGIKALIADAFSYILGYGSVIGGVRLQVLDADAERARAILSGEEFGALTDDRTIVAEAPDADADAVGNAAFKETVPDTKADQPIGWTVWLLFLFGILCLILGRPVSAWGSILPFSGHFMLMGEILIVVGLWIVYGRLNAKDEQEKQSRMDTNEH